MKNTDSALSKEPDPYTYEHYPEKFAVQVGRQTHNARQLLRAAVHRARYGASGPAFLNMYRQPIPDETVDEIFRKTGHVYHDGRWHSRRTMTRIRRDAARELRRRQGLPVYNDQPHGSSRPTYRPPALDSVRRRLFSRDHYDGMNYDDSSNNNTTTTLPHRLQSLKFKIENLDYFLGGVDVSLLVRLPEHDKVALERLTDHDELSQYVERLIDQGLLDGVAGTTV